MGLRNRNLFTDENCFFVTNTCHNHKYLLFDNGCFDIIIENFLFYNKKYNSKTLAFVLMNNHIHFIIYFEEKNRLEDYIRDFKKFTSLKIRERIQEIRPNLTKEIEFEYRTQHFKIWEDRYDDVVLFTKAVCETKVEYIHNNPVAAGMIDIPENYKYSSASFYATGICDKMELVNYLDIF